MKLYFVMTLLKTQAGCPKNAIIINQPFVNSFGTPWRKKDKSDVHFALQVMISGESSCSDSGLEVRGGSSAGVTSVRHLCRTARVDQESDANTDCSPSPHSSLLDAPLPPTLANFADNHNNKQNNYTSIRIQQNAVR